MNVVRTDPKQLCHSPAAPSSSTLQGNSPRIPPGRIPAVTPELKYSQELFAIIYGIPNKHLLSEPADRQGKVGNSSIPPRTKVQLWSCPGLPKFTFLHICCWVEPQERPEINKGEINLDCCRISCKPGQLQSFSKSNPDSSPQISDCL